MISHAYRLILLAIVSGLLTSCATAVITPKTTPDDRAWLLSGKPLFGEDTDLLTLPEDNVLQLSDEIIQFLSDEKFYQGSDKSRLKSLIAALFQKGGLGFSYQPTATFTARETFQQRRGNCLAFTTLVVVMGRHLGLNAQFNEVDVPYIWDIQSNSTLVLYKHVNAIVDTGKLPKQLVDISMEEYDYSYQQRIIPDQLAVAQYYNNRAMELLYDKEYREAYRYLVKAITLVPNVSYLWSNLGSLFRRADQMQAAELALRIALEISPRNLTAISNAARIYTDLGRHELAERLEKKAEYYRLRNPYYRYKLGLDAFLEKDYSSALTHTQAAIQLYPKEHRFYFLEGMIYLQNGSKERAKQSLDKAIKISSDKKQRAKYQHKMEFLHISDDNTD